MPASLLPVWESSRPPLRHNYDDVIRPSPPALPAPAGTGVSVGLAARRRRTEPIRRTRLHGFPLLPLLGLHRVQLVLRPRRRSCRRTGAAAECRARPPALFPGGTSRRCAVGSAGQPAVLCCLHRIRWFVIRLLA